MSEVATGVPEVVPTQTVVQTTEITSAQKYHQPKRDKQCSVCGESFTPSVGFQKRCPLHLTPPGTDEYRAKNAAEQQKVRAREKKAKAKKDAFWSSKTELSDKEALEILAARVSNEHVRETCLQLGREAAQKLGLVANTFFWTNGAVKALESKNQKKDIPLEIDCKAEIPSEVIFAGDAYFIYAMSVFPHEPDVTFGQFIEQRSQLKESWYALGEWIGMPLEPTHREWENFLPSFKTGLRPNYTFSDMREWLRNQGSSNHSVEVRDFMLMAPRGSMKTSVGAIFLATAILCAPSLRLLLCSETVETTQAFLSAFKKLWEIGVDPAFERFQRWFAEFTVPRGSGNVSSFASPMRSIAVREDTAEILSMAKAAQGRRFDLAWLDDCIGDKTTREETQRRKSFEVYSEILKLRESGGVGIVCTIGTPQIFPPPGEMGDLYWELMERNKNEDWLAIRVDSAWKLKPNAVHLFPTLITTLTQDHVESLAFPERLPFKALIKEAKFDIDAFQSQFLCRYVESTLHKWVPTFVLEDLYAKVKTADFLNGKPTITIVAAVDTAKSESVTADRSSICIAKIVQYKDKKLAFVLEVIAGQWRFSTLAQKLVEAFQKYGVLECVIEKNDLPWPEFMAAVLRHGAITGTMMPRIMPKLSTGTGQSGVSAKMKRIKGAEIAFENDQLYFNYGPTWNEELFHELVRYKGQRSGSSPKAKDDRADSTGILVETFLEPDLGKQPESTPEMLEMERQAEAQNLITLQYAAIFGTPMSPQQQAAFAPPSERPEEPTNRLFSTLGQYGFTRKAA